MVTLIEPTFVFEKNNYLNHVDETYDLLHVYISLKLMFHNEACTIPDEIGTTLADLFGKQDEMRGHMLEVELSSLDPKNFDNIQELFTEFNSLLIHLKGCSVDKSTQETQLILSILVKLGLHYVVSISSFHTNRFTLESTWKMLTLD
jgi:hypothetical protein